LQPGYHVRSLDVSKLAAGMYFLRLKVGGRVQTQRITVVQ